MTLTITTATLEVRPPFDFDQSLRFLGAFHPTRDEQTLAAQSFTKAVRIAGRTVVFRVEAMDGSALRCTLFSERALADRERADALAVVSSFLSLEDDLEPFYAIGRGDAAFAPVIDQLYGYHQVRFLTPFENACWAVLTQRTPIAAARTVKVRLIESFGASLEVDGVAYGAFPEAPDLARADLSTLRAIVGNERRAAYLAAVIQAFASVSQAALTHAPSDELLGWLRSIKGIGSWSSSFILLRGFGRTDILPLDEERLLESVRMRYGHERVQNRAAVAELAAPYGPWQGYWAHYLRVAAYIVRNTRGLTLV